MAMTTRVDKSRLGADNGSLATQARPPAPAPNIVAAIAPEVAIEVNAARPDFEGVLEAAPSFLLPITSLEPSQSHSAEECLSQAIYYEAAGQPLAGQRAVAQVVLNRMRHPGYPKSVCGVVFQGSERRTGCQFSFTCDGSLSRQPSRNGWGLAQQLARQALKGSVERSVGTSTHYHADYVVPYWSSSLQKLVTLGNHIFYRYPGFWGTRRAFTGKYFGEPLGPVQPTVPLEEPAPALAAQSNLPGNAKIDPILAPGGTLLATSGVLAATPGAIRPRADSDQGRLLIDELEQPLRARP